MSGSILADVGILRLMVNDPKLMYVVPYKPSVEIVSSDVTHVWAGQHNVRTLWVNASLSLIAVPLVATRLAFRRQIHDLRGLHPVGCLKLQFSQNPPNLLSRIAHE